MYINIYTEILYTRRRALFFFYFYLVTLSNALKIGALGSVTTNIATISTPGTSEAVLGVDQLAISCPQSVYSTSGTQSIGLKVGGSASNPVYGLCIILC